MCVDPSLFNFFFFFLQQGRPEFTTSSWLCRAESSMLFGSYVNYSFNRFQAIGVSLADFVWVRISVRLFLTYLNPLTVLRGTFATKESQNQFPAKFWMRSLLLLEASVWALKLASRSTLKETSLKPNVIGWLQSSGLLASLRASCCAHYLSSMGHSVCWRCPSMYRVVPSLTKPR